MLDPNQLEIGHFQPIFFNAETAEMQRKNSVSPRPLRFMTSDREPLLLEPQRAPMKALPSNARLKLMSNPQNAFQSNYPVASPRKMAL